MTQYSFVCASITDDLGGGKNCVHLKGKDDNHHQTMWRQMLEGVPDMHPRGWLPDCNRPFPPYLNKKKFGSRVVPFSRNWPLKSDDHKSSGVLKTEMNSVTAEQEHDRQCTYV
jgi:hypothetical protein